MNANNKYTVGRKIDGKKINTDHDYLAGDESESVDMDKRIAVTKRNGRIEFTGNTFDHKEMLKDMFKARWDADAKVWWVFDHKTLHKIKTELRDHGLYDNRNDAAFDRDEWVEGDGDYVPPSGSESSDDEENADTSSSDDATDEGTQESEQSEKMSLKEEVMNLMDYDDDDVEEKSKNKCKKRSKNKRKLRSRSRAKSKGTTQNTNTKIAEHRTGTSKKAEHE
eukprot:478060_1